MVSAFLLIFAKKTGSNMYSTVLVVDDNKEVLISLKYLLKKTFEQVLTLASPESIPQVMNQDTVSVVLLDMNFALGLNTGGEGLFWLEKIKQLHPEVPVVLFTAYADIELAVRALKQGASDFVVKPWDNDKLVFTLTAAIDRQNDIRTLAEVEDEHIRAAVDKCNGNLRLAADLLGISRQTLYNKLKSIR